MSSDTQAVQARAARVAGAMYLFVMAAGIFGESFVRSSLITWGDAERTAGNVTSAEQLFRIGIATDLIMCSAMVVLAWALYAALRSVHRNVALLGALLRTVEVAVVFVATLFSLIALDLLSGARFLTALDDRQRHALALVSLSAQGNGMTISFVLSGLGSGVFAYLLARSGYVPRVLAVWGVFASFLLVASTLVLLVFPAVARHQISLAVPIGLYEVTVGAWLLLRGVGAGSRGVR